MLPTDPLDVYWMLLTLAGSPSEQAMQIFALEVPTRDDPDVSVFSENPLLQLSICLTDIYSGWLDEFDPYHRHVLALRRLLRDMAICAAEEAPGPMCREEFLHGEYWELIRQFAREALLEAGLEPWPLPEKVCFRDFADYFDDYYHLEW